MKARLVFLLFFINIIVCSQEWQLLSVNFAENKSGWYPQGCFVTENIGYWASGDYLYKTTDQGKNWLLTRKNWNHSTLAVDFINTENGWLSASDGLYKTTDGANSWEKITTSLVSIRTIDFIDSNNGIIGGIGGFQKTTDGGINWIIPSVDSISNNLLDVKKLQYLQSGNCWAVCDINKQSGYRDFSVALKSEDSGNTWQIKLQTESYLFGLFFLNPLYGCIVDLGYGAGSIYTTYDGGNSWNTNTENPYHLLDVYLLNDTLGWAVGEISIFETRDRAKTWRHLKRVDQVALEGDLTEIGFTPDKKLGYIFGFEKVLLLYDNTITKVEQQNTSLPKEYSLSQNYPNPLNQTTIIEYSIPAETHNAVTLRIYDTLGREVARLVNKAQTPGNYSVKWDADSYASGLYFYALVHGSQQITKKMLLIK